MKKISHISVWNVAVLALAVLAFGGVGVKTFAAADDFRPVGCTDGLPMTVYAVPSTFTGGDIYTHMIYVVSGDYIISSNIVMDDCSVIVVDENSTGATFTFQNGSYISSNTQDNILIRGHADKKLTLINGATSPGAIILQNVVGATVSYTSISGFAVNGGIRFFNTQNSIINNNILTNNKHGIRLSGTSTGNIITDNDITNNTDKGIWIGANSNNNTGSNNRIIGNGIYGIDINGAKSCTISYNTISNHVGGAGLFLSQLDSENNTIQHNTISSNAIGIRIDGAKSNNFSSNIISSNTSRGVRLYNNATGNIFNGDIFSGNISNNINISNAHNNQFINITGQNSSVGANLTNANYNTFSGSTIVNNTNGIILDNSSYNTVNLVNNNNGITLNGGSNNNNIYNDQPTNNPLNNIVISNGSNNTITGGLFTTASTTSTSVYVNFLQNNYAPVTYSITGNGLSGTYENIDMTGLTGATIEFTTTNETKNIVVTYNNGNNKQYDSIYLGTIVTPPSGGNSGGGGGGGGGSVSCISSQLVCSGGVRTRVSGTSCTSSLIGNACTVGGTGTLPVGSIVGSTYSTELNNAYLWAYANGVTTMNTIQKANMTGALIRAHMAKMISNLAITLGGLTPDTSKQCIFTDIANQSAEMKFYIKLSCQLGLMGQEITKFDPTTIVTRAQFGTILSRVLWGDRYEGGVKYYTDHLAALKRATIMTKIENPNMKEIRGYVMIMMKRAQDLEYLTD